MNYYEIVESFLRECPHYKGDITNFSHYLETKWKESLTSEAVQILLQGVDVDLIVDSLDYNVEERKKYTKRTAAKKYATVVGQFFDFVRKNTDVKNRELFDAVSYGRNHENAYMKRMMEYISCSKTLEGMVEAEILSTREVEQILVWTDRQLDKSMDWNIPMNFRKAMAALGIKFILIYGLTYRELRKLKWEQYDEELGTIIIGGYKLRLPMKMFSQLRRLREFLLTTGKGYDSDFILVDTNGSEWGEITSSSGIPDYLGNLIGNTSITSVVKYGIRELIMAGISDTIIKQITGASDKLINGSVNQDDESMNEIVNNKLVTVNMYYKF